MRLRLLLTRWMHALQRRRFVARLARLDARRRRLETAPAAANRSEALCVAQELETLCIERARLRYFIAAADGAGGAPSASSTYRRQERAVPTNCSSGHSPRLRNSLPNATHK
jgi:hypothetical protein